MPPSGVLMRGVLSVRLEPSLLPVLSADSPQRCHLNNRRLSLAVEAQRVGILALSPAGGQLLPWCVRTRHQHGRAQISDRPFIVSWDCRRIRLSICPHVDALICGIRWRVSSLEATRDADAAVLHKCEGNHMLRRPIAGALLGRAQKRLDRFLVDHAAPRSLQHLKAAGLPNREALISCERRHQGRSWLPRIVARGNLQPQRAVAFATGTAHFRKLLDSLVRDTALRRRRNSGTIDTVEPNSLRAGQGRDRSVQLVLVVWNMATVSSHIALTSTAKRAKGHDGVPLDLWALIVRLHPGSY